MNLLFLKITVIDIETKEGKAYTKDQTKPEIRYKKKEGPGKV